MSLKNSYTTSDYLQWDTATTLVRKLYRDKNYRISLLIGCGIFFGLRVSDLLRLNWNMLLNKEAKFVLIEKKTGKRREVKINREFQKHIKDCYHALHINNMDEFCFLSARNKVYSVQWINLILKELKYRYNLKIEHFSTHSLRKTFGRKVFESSDSAELALVKLMELFNHSSIAITKRYLGLRQEEILETYDVLSF
ncbi:MAG: tyrosine-type recombinase/integrase [Bacteroidaceae bacterium]|nr:tyrosine-type recombinase/integrase [Bacteroidaceae bacterium]